MIAADPPTRRARCSVCSSPHRAQIEVLRASGMKYSDIETELRKLGSPRKRETIGKHFAICLGGRPPKLSEETAVVVNEAIGLARDEGEADFARLVRDRAATMLADGALRVTASHGLAAQALLDRRAEKQADRDLALNMARLLSGAISLPPSEVIEGRFIAVSEEPTLLAPASVVETR